MDGFRILTPDNQVIRFRYYLPQAAATCRSFEASLPFQQVLFHARVSGLEIWTEDGPKLNLPQENSSIFAAPGEIVLGPILPERNRIRGCLGIFYGEGKLLDCGNIFGKVVEDDFEKLRKVGDTIWRKGGIMLRFELLEIK
jgi:hypothetical protein